MVLEVKKVVIRLLVLILFSLWIWVLATQVCLLCENLSTVCLRFANVICVCTPTPFPVVLFPFPRFIIFLDRE